MADRKGACYEQNVHSLDGDWIRVWRVNCASLSVLLVGMCVFGFQLAEWAEWQGRIAGVVATIAGVAGAVMGLKIAFRAEQRATE